MFLSVLLNDDSCSERAVCNNSNSMTQLWSRRLQGFPPPHVVAEPFSHFQHQSCQQKCWNVHYFTNQISSSDNFRKKIRHAGGFVIVIESAARRARLGADVESETERLRRRVTKFLLSAAREITWKLYCPWIFHFFICSVSDTRAEVQSAVTPIVRFECVGDTRSPSLRSPTLGTARAGSEIMLPQPLITAFLCKISLSNSHKYVLGTSTRQRFLPGDNVRRESSVAWAVQGTCV